MRNRPWPSDLDDYSALIGKNSFMVQGPGGNTSYKNQKTMWIKASGKRLADANEMEIFVEVDFGGATESKGTSLLRPSIEKDFHQLIPFSYVIHTHSVRAISIAISSDFLSNSKSHFACVPYGRPGEALCDLISKVVDFKKHKGAILQNHGFLTWGNTMEEAYEILRKFEGKHDLSFTNAKNYGNNTLNLDHPRAITPDYAVFLSEHTEEEILNFGQANQWKKEMYEMAKLSVSLLRPHQKINYLQNQEIVELQNWDSEKLRKILN